LNKFITSKEDAEIFTPFQNHVFLVGENAVTIFDWFGGPVNVEDDKPGYRAYLRLLNLYRTRLNARLLIPPKIDYTEESYFNYWRETVSQ